MPPLGWYYAQGLYPLGSDSSDDDEGPTQLPDGRTVCGPHGFQTCNKCCMDFSAVNEALEPMEDYDSDADSYDGPTFDEASITHMLSMLGLASPYDDKEDAWEDDDDEGISNGAVEDEAAPPWAGACFMTHAVAADPDEPDNTSRNPQDETTSVGRVFAARFFPPEKSTTPEELFTGLKTSGQVQRIVHHDDLGKVLIRTDGGCLNNGQADPKAGWGVWHGLDISGRKVVAYGRLESQGPLGEDSQQTSNRAELRAVIAALRLCHWAGEGFHTLVIATDSEYVVKGSTKWTKTWLKNGWKTKTGGEVKNIDMWKTLLAEFESWKNAGMKVQFWKIPREWNKVADAAARQGALSEDAPERWGDIISLAC